MKKTILISLVACLMISCGAFTSSVYVENDKVMNIRRASYELIFFNNQRNEHTYQQNLTFLKETDSNNITTYTMYDVITVPSESFDINENKIFIIIDDDIIPFQTTFNKQFNNRKITEQRDEVMKSDSTKVSVVTGYDVVNKKSIQMTHILNEELINKIRQAKLVNLRYYIGPSYINSEIKGAGLGKLKKAIEI